MATRTTREITLPPEIVALVISFKPVASHPDRTWDRRLWEPIIFEYRGETTLFHKCCGKGWYDRSNVCTQIAKGMYHPGKLEVTILPGSRLHRGTTKSLQWSCCGTKVFTQSAIGRTPHSRAPGCTPLDLTLRVTTVTRSARDSPRVVVRPPDTPFAARRVSYSREDVFQGLEELYAMGGRMRELACMFGTRLRWTPPHLRAGDSEQTA